MSRIDFSKRGGRGYLIIDASEMDAEMVREIFDYDAHGTGNLTWKISIGPHSRIGQVAGCLNRNGYINVKIGGREFKAHRLGWLHFYGVWPSKHLDHKNRIRNSNQIWNLRESDDEHNQHNVGLAKHNKSGIKGVYKHKMTGKWVAQIRSKGRNIHIGLFDDITDAKNAFINMERELYGEFSVFSDATAG